MTVQLLLTEAEAAERLNLCQRTLRKARQSGQLHYVAIGRAVRYTIEDLESFVATLRQVQPNCPKPRTNTKSTRPSGKGGVIVPFTVRSRRR